MRQSHSNIMTSFVRAGLLGRVLGFRFGDKPGPGERTTGKPGSPSATTTIDGQQLPAPDPAFGGVIKDDALQSTPWWAPRILPPKDAPNILLIITDDVGFGVSSTFGGVIPTPTMDPFPLTAKLQKLTIKMDRPQLTPEDIAKLEKAQEAAADAN